MTRNSLYYMVLRVGVTISISSLWRMRFTIKYPPVGAKKGLELFHVSITAVITTTMQWHFNLTSNIQSLLTA